MNVVTAKLLCVETGDIQFSISKNILVPMCFLVCAFMYDTRVTQRPRFPRNCGFRAAPREIDSSEGLSIVPIRFLGHDCRRHARKLLRDTGWRCRVSATLSIGQKYTGYPVLPTVDPRLCASLVLFRSARSPRITSGTG